MIQHQRLVLLLWTGSLWMGLCGTTNCFISLFLVMMSAWALVPLSSTSLQMTHLRTPCWTPATEDQSRRSGPASPAWMLENRQPAPPGSPTTHWDGRSTSINTSHPSPSPWRRRHLMSQCLRSRGSPSPSCHVTFINTNRWGGTMATPSTPGQTRSFSLFHSTNQLWDTF